MSVQRIRRHGPLLRNLIRREVRQRHKGSVLGLGWNLVIPAVMIGTYTFVFRYIFRSAVPDYALYLVTGHVSLLPKVENVERVTKCSSGVTSDARVTAQLNYSIVSLDTSSLWQLLSLSGQSEHCLLTSLRGFPRIFDHWLRRGTSASGRSPQART